MSTLQWTSLAQSITKKPPGTSNGDNAGSTPTAQRAEIMSSPIGVRFVSNEIKRDHRGLEILYKGLVQAVDEGDDQAAAALQNRFSWELARHLVAMQLFVFPGTERRANEGNRKALRRRDDLATICDHLLHFIDLAPSDAAFGAACARLDGVVRQHIRDVEHTDLVAIETALDGEESERMAQEWESAGGFVPGEVEGRIGGPPPPFATVGELLKASYGELRRAWERLQRGGTGKEG